MVRRGSSISMAKQCKERPAKGRNFREDVSVRERARTKSKRKKRTSPQLGAVQALVILLTAWAQPFK
jgi:hypothetical protein